MSRRRGLLIVLQHDGYRDGETPVYRLCSRCRQQVRIDRLDLIREHKQTCGVERRAALVARLRDAVARDGPGAVADAILATGSPGRRVAKLHIPPPQPQPLDPSLLSPALRSTAELVAEGLKNSEIAARRGVSIETTKTHVKQLLRMTGAQNRTQFALLWKETQP